MLAGCGVREQIPETTEPYPVSENIITDEKPQLSGSENTLVSEMTVEEVFLEDSMEFAENSAIHTDTVRLYHDQGTEKGDIVICDPDLT